MSYRDDLDAAHERIRVLEEECANLRAQAAPVSEKPAKEPLPPGIARTFARLLGQRLGVCLLILAGISGGVFLVVFWTFSIAVVTGDNVCVPAGKDWFCRTVLFPRWVHTFVVGSPVLVVLGALVVSSWREAKKKMSGGTR